VNVRPTALIVMPSRSVFFAKNIRMREMAELKEGGATLKQIAGVFDLSQEYVRQTIKKAKRLGLA